MASARCGSSGNQYKNWVARLEESVRRQNDSMRYYERQQRRIFDAAYAFLLQAYDFFYKQLGRQAFLPDRGCFDWMCRMFAANDRSFSRLGNLEARLQWLQQLFIAGKCQTELMTFDDLNKYFQNKSTDMQRLACEIGFLFEKWEPYIHVELQIVRGQVVSSQEYVSRQTKTGNWHRVKRTVFKTLPDRARLVMTLVSFPKLPVNRKR